MKTKAQERASTAYTEFPFCGIKLGAEVHPLHDIRLFEDHSSDSAEVRSAGKSEVFSIVAEWSEVTGGMKEAWCNLRREHGDVTGWCRRDDAAGPCLRNVKWDEILTAAKKLPATIQSCGLIQTLAVFQDGAKALVRDILEKWLRCQFSSFEEKDFLTEVADSEVALYRMYRAEAIEFAIWLKRAAEAEGDT